MKERESNSLREDCAVASFPLFWSREERERRHENSIMDNKEPELNYFAECDYEFVAEDENKKKEEESSEPLVMDTSQELYHLKGEQIPKRKPKRKKKVLYSCTCQGCDTVFTTMANRRRHERLHLGEKPFVCDHPECPKRFARKYDLKVHIRTHTKEKPYICGANDCGRKFSRNSSLREHERNVHHLPSAKIKEGNQEDPNRERKGRVLVKKLEHNAQEESYNSHEKKEELFVPQKKNGERNQKMMEKQEESIDREQIADVISRFLSAQAQGCEFKLNGTSTTKSHVQYFDFVRYKTEPDSNEVGSQSSNQQSYEGQLNATSTSNQGLMSIESSNLYSPEKSSHQWDDFFCFSQE